MEEGERIDEREFLNPWWRLMVYIITTFCYFGDFKDTESKIVPKFSKIIDCVENQVNHRL